MATVKDLRQNNMIKYQVDYDYDDMSWIVWKIIFGHFNGVGKRYSWVASFATRQMARDFKRMLENNIHVDYYDNNGKKMVHIGMN